MKGIVSKILSASDEVFEWMGKILSLSEIVICVCLLFEVICRYFFNSPTNWSQAFCLYLFGASGVLCGGWILKRDKNIRVDLIYSTFPKRGQAAADVIACLFIIFWGYLIVRFGWAKFMNAVVRNEISFTSWTIPMWPIRLTIPVGGVFLIMAAICKLIRSAYTLFTGGDI